MRRSPCAPAGAHGWIGFSPARPGRAQVAPRGHRIGGAGDLLVRIEPGLHRGLQVVRPLGHGEARVDQAQVQRLLHVAAQARRDARGVLQRHPLAVVERGRGAAEGARRVLQGQALHQRIGEADPGHFVVGTEAAVERAHRAVLALAQVAQRRAARHRRFGVGIARAVGGEVVEAGAAVQRQALAQAGAHRQVLRQLDAPQRLVGAEAAVGVGVGEAVGDRELHRGLGRMAGDIVQAGVAAAAQEADLAADGARQAVAVGDLERIEVVARQRADPAHRDPPGARLARRADHRGVAEHRQGDAGAVAHAVGIDQHHRDGVGLDRGARRHPGDVGADLEALLGDRADRGEVDRERQVGAVAQHDRRGVVAAQRIDRGAVAAAASGGFGQRGVGVEMAGAGLPGQAPGHIAGGAAQDVLDLGRGQVGVGFQHQRDHAGHVRGGHRGAAHVGVERQVGRRQGFRIVLRGQQRQHPGAVAGGHDVHAGGDDRRLVDIGPLAAVGHAEVAGLAAVAARGEIGEHAVLLAGADRDHPRRLRIGVVGVLARAVVAGREHADDAAPVQLVGGDVDRIGRIELAAAAPGVAGHPDRVAEAELMGRGVVEPAHRIEDEQHRARTVADQARARRGAAVQAVGTRAAAADGAGAVGAVARAQVGVDLILDIGDRHQARHQAVGHAGQHVLRREHVLHHVAAELDVLVAGVDARIVDHHADAAAAERHGAAVIAGVVDRARGAGDFPRFLVEVTQWGVEEHRFHVVPARQRADFRGRRQRAGDRQAAHGHAAFDAQLAQRAQLRRVGRARLLVADDHLQFLVRQGVAHQRQQLRIQVGIGEGDPAERQAQGEGGDAQARAATGREDRLVHGRWTLGRLPVRSETESSVTQRREVSGRPPTARRGFPLVAPARVRPPAGGPGRPRGRWRPPRGHSSPGSLMIW